MPTAALLEELEKDPEFQRLPRERREAVRQEIAQRLAQPPTAASPAPAESATPEAVPQMETPGEAPQADVLRQRVAYQMGESPTPPPIVAKPGNPPLPPELGQFRQDLITQTPPLLQRLLRIGGDIAAGTAGQRGGMAAQQALTGTPGGAVGRIAGGAALTVALHAIEQKAQTGDYPGAKDLLIDTMWQVGPQIAEELMRGAGRYLLRGTPGARVIAFDEAARRARLLTDEAFPHADQATIGQMFESVRQSGVTADMTPLVQYVNALTPGKQKEVLSQIAQLDARLMTGGRFGQELDALLTQAKTGRTGLDIGEAQYLSSELRKRLARIQTPEARDLLGGLRDAIDQGVFSGRTVGATPAGDVPAVLQEARRQYARTMAAHDLSDLIERKITGNPAAEDLWSLNLRSLRDELRRNTSDLAQSVNRALDLTPGARQAFNTNLEGLSRFYNTIETSIGSDVAGLRRWAVVAEFSRMLSHVMLTNRGMAFFRQAVLEGRGATSVNAIGLAASIAKRELETLQAPQQESPR